MIIVPELFKISQTQVECSRIFSSSSGLASSFHNFSKSLKPCFLSAYYFQDSESLFHFSKSLNLGFLFLIISKTLRTCFIASEFFPSFFGLGSSF
jgi:hypothetical protein